ncbi:MAG: DUF1573 domain-containing protein [Verrucomicrobia bacterium]|nr:DUF1573 domain-containing protein [Verrucomicrobiota bacterium]
MNLETAIQQRRDADEWPFSGLNLLERKELVSGPNPSIVRSMSVTFRFSLVQQIAIGLVLWQLAPAPAGLVAQESGGSSPTATKSLPPLPPIPKARLAGERPVRPLGRPINIPNALSVPTGPRAPGLDFPPAPLANPSAQFTGVSTPVAQPAGLPGTNPAVTVPMPEGILAWKTDAQEHHIKTGETNAHFVFAFTNVASSNVVITAVRTTCGCTTVNMPTLPWTIKPGQHSEFGIDVDVRRKVGVLSKPVTVETTAGYKTLTTRVHIPHLVNGDASQFPGSNSERSAERARNVALAAQDRQKVFKGECAVCHVEPTKGQMGETLFTAACSICHEGPNRATMVPDLASIKFPRDKTYWHHWITVGKEGSLMPQFAHKDGGPLSDEQIQSLVDFLLKKFPATAAATSAGTAP